MCDKAVDRNPWYLKYIPHHFKTQEMCEKAVDKFPLEYIPRPIYTSRNE